MWGVGSASTSPNTSNSRRRRKIRTVKISSMKLEVVAAIHPGCFYCSRLSMPQSCLAGRTLSMPLNLLDSGGDSSFSFFSSSPSSCTSIGQLMKTPKLNINFHPYLEPPMLRGYFSAPYQSSFGSSAWAP